MKLEWRMYQAVTQVNVLSSVISKVVEVDVFICAENNTKAGAMASQLLLYRGLRQWHDTRWNRCELGRPVVFFRANESTLKQVRKDKDQRIDATGVGLTDSTLSMGKLCTWESGQR